jgi:colanic acid/amylovoran biosynthesis protein
MTIINWGKQHSGFDFQAEYETACAEAIRWFIAQAKGKVILFPQVFGPYLSQDDRVPARRVAESLNGLSDSIITVEEPIPLEQLKSIYAWMDVLIGTRMHSNIFALSEGVPVIMIGYLPKTRGMAEMFGIEEWCVDIGEASGNELISRLQKYWEKRVYWPEGKEAEFRRLISSTKQVGAWVHEDYLAWERKAR